MLDNNASAVTATVNFLNFIDWAFLNDSDFVKLLLSVWVFIVIFWVYCFERRTHCKLYKRNIVTSVFRVCWLKKLLILSVCCVLKSVSLSAI